MSKPDEGRSIVIIAGPNGAGKTTFARYKLLVNNWQLYDNSVTPTILLDEGGLP